MDKSSKYNKCYSVLGVLPDDKWETIRRAYKSQIRRWHPDRYQNRHHQQLAEEKTKEINRAYHELYNYLRSHGTLPPSAQAAATPGAAQHPVHAREPSQSARRPAQSTNEAARELTAPRAPQRKRYSSVAVAVISIAAAFLIWDQYRLLGHRLEVNDYEHPDESFPNIRSGFPTPPEKTRTEYRVLRKLDPPIDTTTSSRKEIDSSINPNTATPTTPDPAAPRAFGHGSSKEIVLAVQGVPDRQTEHVWYYGTSRVYFRNNKVAGWADSPSVPLRLHVRQEGTVR